MFKGRWMGGWMYGCVDECVVDVYVGVNLIDRRELCLGGSYKDSDGGRIGFGI